MRSIELVFDDDTESAIRADWVRLAEAGLPSLASHTGASNRPHLTLAAGAELLVQPLHAFDGALPIEAASPVCRFLLPGGTGMSWPGPWC